MFKLPDLPFSADALAPVMSRETLGYHHGKHHAAYIKKTNAALAERKNAPQTLEEVVRLAAREGDGQLFNNAAQAWNHALFWQSLSAKPVGEPQGGLRSALERRFGSMSAFRDEFLALGGGHFGSGWVWLVADENGGVGMDGLHDADTPVVDPRVTPLLACDLWEHAYYLDYKNDRGAFLAAFFDRLANWRFAERQYEAATHGGAGAWSFPR